MTKKERALAIAEILEQYFPVVPIPLEHRDPYTLLVAVLLSAQATDKSVNKVTPELFALADTPGKMVRLDPADIERIIKPVGLSPKKSRAIHELSAILVEKYGGSVPADMEALEALPGVGHKTASVVVSQAFGIPAFPVDTHIHRLAYRWKLSTGKNVVKTETDLKKLYPPEMWNKLHLQIIYFGREYCPARGHDPSKCPVCSKFGRKNR
jgi:endonuclease-3